MANVKLNDYHHRLQRITDLKQQLVDTFYQPKRDRIRDEIKMLEKGVDIDVIIQELKYDLKRLPYGKGIV